MARYSSGMTAAGAGTSVRPIFAVVGSAALTIQLREISLWNTTAVACTYRLVAFTGGTAGTAQTMRKWRRNSLGSNAIASGLWVADATIVEDCGERMVLGAAIGSAAILTFGGDGIESTIGTGSGLGLVPVGTGQVCEVKFTWDE